MFLLVKEKEEVCKERAKAYIKSKYGEQLSLLKSQAVGSNKRRVKMEIYKLKQTMKKEQHKAYIYFLNNYQEAEDSYANKKARRKTSFSRASRILKQALKDME